MMTPNIEQLLSQLEQQSEILNKEIQFRKRAEFLSHQHIETLESKNKEITLLANIAVNNLCKPITLLEKDLIGLKSQNQLTNESILQKFISHLENSLSDLSNKLNYYRELSSPKSDNTPFTLLSIQTLLEQALHEQNELIKTHSANILYDAAQFKDRPSILGREEQLSAVIQQLISNAIQYRSEAPIQIEFKLEILKGFCLFSIQDNGRGISPKHFEQIFWIIKPDEASGEYQRNSMGLAVCKKVIEHHQGKIWVTSTPNRGSTFYIMLPLSH